MTLFYFDSFDGRRKPLDNETFEFPDHASARAAAASLLLTMVKQQPLNGEMQTFRVRVRDESGVFVQAGIYSRGEQCAPEQITTAKTNHPIRLGDTVRLLWGGPMMTVSTVEPDGTVICTWINRTNGAYAMEFGAFRIELLKPGDDTLVRV